MHATKPSPGSSLAGNVIPAQQIHFAKPNEKRAAALPAPKPAEVAPKPIEHQPQVTLLKEGDTVYAIEILCTCGEVIRLDCKYAE